jgi:uncharacterized membrane protein YraQ (UPF0718 family)
VDYESLILVFTSIIYEALPFIVLGVVIAGLLEEFVPQQALANIIPTNRFIAVGLGGLLGVVFPMCECGIIVVMRRLLRKGLPLSVCVAYMLAGPVINVVVLASTYVAFNPPQERDQILGGPVNVVLLRAGLAYVVAVVTACIVEWQWRRYGSDLLHPMVASGLRHREAEDDVNSGPRTTRARLENVTQTALNDFVDIMAFLILGALLATTGRVVLDRLTVDIARVIQEQSAVHQALKIGDTSVAEKQKRLADDTQRLAERYRSGIPARAALDKAVTAMHEATKALQEGQQQQADAQQGNALTALQEAREEATKQLLGNPATAILLMMTIAVLFCLCSEADAFVAANFQTFWPPASKIAFLVLGPMLDIKLYLMYTRVFRPRLIFTIMISVAVQVFIYTMILHYLDQ